MLTTHSRGISAMLLCAILFQGCHSQLNVLKEEGGPSNEPPQSGMHETASSGVLNAAPSPSLLPLQPPNTPTTSYCTPVSPHAQPPFTHATPSHALRPSGAFTLAAKRQKTGENTLTQPAAPGDADASDRPYDVFISHAGEDKESVAEPLYNRLTSRGIKVFFDREE